MCNQGKIILDLCGGTGSWSKPYKDAGYDVRLVTLPDYDVTQAAFHEDGLFLPRKGECGYVGDTGGMAISYKSVHGILAAPPCTEFSLAKNGAPTPRDLRAGMD